jgi:hypothetical protein
MNEHASIQLWLANERAASQMREASNSRLATANTTQFRRTVGLSIIRIGERLAAEPSLRPARVP